MWFEEFREMCFGIWLEKVWYVWGILRGVEKSEKFGLRAAPLSFKLAWRGKVGRSAPPHYA